MSIISALRVSRFATGSHESMDVWLKALKNTFARGQLTEQGQQLLSQLDQMQSLGDLDNAGSITRFGVQQLKNIGKRIAEQFEKDNLLIVAANACKLRTQQSQESLLSGMGEKRKLTTVRLGKIMANIINPHDNSPSSPYYSQYHGVNRSMVYLARENCFNEHFAKVPSSLKAFIAQYVVGLDTVSVGRAMFALLKICQHEASINVLSGTYSRLQTHICESPNGMDSYHWVRTLFCQEQYYLRGNSLINQGIHKVMGKSMLEHFFTSSQTAATSPSSGVDIECHIGHTAGITFMLIGLDLLKDEGFDCDRLVSWYNWGQMPMSGNIIWQLVRNKQNPSDLRVRMLLNEQPVLFPFTDDPTDEYMSWNKVANYYQQALNKIPDYPEFLKGLDGSHLTDAFAL